MKHRTLLLCLALVFSAALAIGGTMAYLQDTDEDVNVMTLGNVHIEQLEYERVVENGAWVSTGEEDKYGYTPDEIQPFTQDKPLYPAVFVDGVIKWDDRNGNQNASGEGSHQQSWAQVVSKDGTPTSGSNQLFDDSVKNVIDKFVFVENTGKSDAYVRTWFAFEQGDVPADEFKSVIMTNTNQTHWSWETVATDVTIEDSKYVILCATYLGPKSNATGILAPGAVTYPSLLQVYMKPEAGNEEVNAIDGNKDGKYNILVVSQAVQTAGFADAKTALNEAFGTNPPAFSTTQKYPEAEITPPEEGAVFSTLSLRSGETVSIESLETDTPLVIEGEGTIMLGNANVTSTASGTPGLMFSTGSKVTLNVTGTSTFTGATGGDGITIEEDADVVITGNGKLTAIGNGGKEDWNTTGASGHGIGGTGDIVIKDLADLDAQGYGLHATGIGGSSSSITIENTKISNVSAGYSTITWKPTDYGKEDPEGAPAIGSLEDNAVINLKGDTIVSAKGGSKAAGIGARFWKSVTINIENCVIEEAVGGNYGAGIGGSRVHQRTEGDTRQYTTITIVDSTINAQGGLYGAGIGGAYDTHCQNPEVSCLNTIYIKGNSVITAEGGERAAGIGTGYHSGALAGEIETSVTVTAKAGGDPYKYGTYSQAQDVGFGILDPTRSGLNNEHYILYQGVKVYPPAVD